MKKTNRHISRRKLLSYSGALGVSGLTGCVTMPNAQKIIDVVNSIGTSKPEDRSDLLPRVLEFERKGDTARAQSFAIFKSIDVSIHAPKGANLEEVTPLPNEFYPPEGGGFKPKLVFHEGVPIVPHQVQEKPSPELTLAIKTYEASKKQITASLKPGERLSYDNTVTMFAPALAGVVRVMLNEAAMQDKEAYEEEEKAKKKGGLRKIERQGTKIIIPHGQMFTYVQKGYCMDPSLPAPTKGDAYEVLHVSDRVPKPLIPLYQAVGAWSALPENKSSAQSLIWAVMGAGTYSGWSTKVSPEVLAQMNAAMPGGAELFRSYHNGQILAKELIKLIIKNTNLHKYIDPNVLFDPNTRNRIAHEHMQELIRQGQAMTAGKGVGYSMIAPNVAARATGESTLTPNIQIVNVSGKDFEYDILEWFGQPIAPKQGVSATTDILGTAERQVAVKTKPTGTPPEWFEHVLKDISKFAASHFIDKLGVASPAGKFSIIKLRKITGLLKLSNSTKKPIFDLAVAGLSAVPVVGNVLSLYEFITGKDWYDGGNLSAAERVIAGVGTVPGANVLKAIANSLNLGKGSSALTKAANTWAFKTPDKDYAKLDYFKILNDFIWSDSALDLVKAQRPGSIENDILQWNADTKKTIGQVFTVSAPAPFWQPIVKKALEVAAKDLANKTNEYLPGLAPTLGVKIEP